MNQVLNGKTDVKTVAVDFYVQYLYVDAAKPNGSYLFNNWCKLTQVRPCISVEEEIESMQTIPNTAIKSTTEASLMTILK